MAIYGYEIGFECPVCDSSQDFDSPRNAPEIIKSKNGNSTKVRIEDGDKIKCGVCGVQTEVSLKQPPEN